ncbi:MAG: NifB/NifX family molybdenum-iron cluster-binding protein [Anaerolineae bacterium]|nr:NifB/NifX family molybdenum-iron cluster-binding protein [Anaerolineae bacterium]
MKIAISSTDGKLDTPFNPRFGRCEYFIFVDGDTREWEAKANPAASARGGAGPQAAQFLASSGVEAAISGKFGPNAYSSLEAAGIGAYEADSGTPADLLDRFLAGTLKQVNAPTGPKRH